MNSRVSTYLEKIIFTFTVTLTLGCESRAPEIKYYPSDREFSEVNSEFIGLDTTKLNFCQITNKIRNYDLTPTDLVLELEDRQVKKRILPYVYGVGCIRENNLLKIGSDSIFVDDGYPISELKRILKRHYSNWGEVPYYSESPEKALIELTIDESSNGKKIKDVLTELTRSFDQIRTETSDTIELRVFFNCY